MASDSDSFESAKSTSTTSLVVETSEDSLLELRRSLVKKSFTTTEKRLVTRVYKHFLEKVAHEKIKLENPIDVLRSLWYIVDGFGNLSKDDKKKIVILLIEDIAAGKDGILDTEDDIIPYHILKPIIRMIECDLITSTIDLICEATHMKTGVTMSMYVFQLLSYFIFCRCFRRHKSTSSINQPLLRK